jgi:hypothetical protein
MALFAEDFFNSVFVTTGLVFRKVVNLGGNTALTAGGAQLATTTSAPTTSPALYVGSGAPTITAPQGSLYLRSDGSTTATRLYVNTTGSTTWTNVTTAA